MGEMGVTERPLAGRHIAITRPPEQAPELAALLERAGARVTLLSSIAIAALEDTAALDEALRSMAAFDWIVLTSVNGVAAVSTRLAALGLDWAVRGQARVAVIGPATARALQAQGVTPDLIPDEYVAEGILEGLGAVAGTRILLLRADIARRSLAEGLRARGATVEEVTAYRTVERPVETNVLRALLEADRPDAITFTSSSTVRGLLKSLPTAGPHPHDALAGIALACIGPITAGTLREHGLEPAVVADEYTVPGLARSLAGYFSSQPARQEAGDGREAGNEKEREP